jgi:anti-anti-sigma factor
VSTRPAKIETTASDEGCAIVTVRGEIDLSNADEIQLRIYHAIANADDVVLDLTPLEFLDSQGLRVVFSLHERITKRGGSFVVIAPGHSPAGHLLALLQAGDVLTVREVRD